MEIINIKDKNILNEFVGSQKYSQFLQSWQWGEFHRKIGGEVFRVGIENNGKLVAAATFIKKQLPMGRSYFYCPRGPIIKAGENKSEVWNLLHLQVKKIAKEERVMFLRFEPGELSTGNKTWNSTIKTIDVQPSKTSILDLTKPQDDILNSMHQKTRYNIKLAKKKGVEITETDVKYFDSFWRILGETTERDKFRSHGQDYYAEMLKTDSSFIKLYVAKYEGKVIAANIVSFFGDTVTYMHGASSQENRNVMAPYLLQWHVIKQAKGREFKYYDFFGIDESKWPGVTRFKKGFNGEDVSYPGTFDLIFDKGWYNIYGMIRKMRRTF